MDQDAGPASLFVGNRKTHSKIPEKLKRFLAVALMLTVTTILNVLLEHVIQPSSLIFVYLVPAIAGAIYFGTWASVLSFTAGFLIFDYGFVEPYFSLHISKPQDIYNITVYFTMAALLTYLINLVRRQNSFLKDRLDRVSLVEDMSRDFLLLTPIEQPSGDRILSDALRTRVFSQLGQLALKYVQVILNVPALVFFREDGGVLRVWAKSSVDLEITPKDSDAAAWTLENGEVSGAGTYTHTENAFYFIPMKSLEEIIGVIGVRYNSKDLFPEQRRLLGTISNLTTMVASSWMSLKFKQGK